MTFEPGWPVPIFPLPEVVFFPGTTLPLHVFEPRYRRMTEDQLAGDGLIAMALLADGWEDDYFGSPAIHPVVTVGSIRRHERLEGGRFNVELQGLVRARVLEEVPGHPYRVGRLVRLEEVPVRPAEAEGLQRRLLEAWQGLLGLSPEQARAVVLLAPGMTLGGLCDRLASLLPLEPASKQALLEEMDPAARSLGLLEGLRAIRGRLKVKRSARTLPGFSMN